MENTEFNPRFDLLESFEHMQNYCDEKLNIPPSWITDHLNRKGLSSSVQDALGEHPDWGISIRQKIDEARTQAQELPSQEQFALIEKLWHEIHEHLKA